MRPALLFVLVLICSCKSTPKQSSSLSLIETCSEPVDVSRFLEPSLSCLKPGIWPQNKEYDKRKLYEAVPCNQVEWLDQTEDVFGDKKENSPVAIRSSRHFQIFDEWLGAEDRFEFEDRSIVSQQRSNNPIMETKFAAKLRSMIQDAQHFIFLDIFLIGGSWGVEIYKDLIEANRRGVQVLVIHDNRSVFAVGNEISELWELFKSEASITNGLVALDANISLEQSPSAIPFGLEKISQLFEGRVNSGISLNGRSDHSKILITDAIFRDSKEELVEGSFVPRALITSKNMVDSAASYYFDESLVVQGPGAVVSQLHYRSDIYWALEQARGKKTISKEDDLLVEGLLNKLNSMAEAPLFVKARGEVELEVLQSLPNDQVRNLDVSILRRIQEAKSSIDIYGKIAYNWRLASALKQAIARGVELRVLLDQQTLDSALLNSTLPFMMTFAPSRLPDGRLTNKLLDADGRQLNEEDLPFKWFVPFRPGFYFASDKRTDLAQEIHAKTMVIDGEWVLFGSTNFDTLTWSGGFREYSAWIKSREIAKKVIDTFERIYNHPLLSVSHEIWLGKKPVPSELSEFFKELRNERSSDECPSEEEICNLDNVVSGGKNYSSLAPNRRLIYSILSSESERIKATSTEYFTYDSDGQLVCQ